MKIITSYRSFELKAAKICIEKARQMVEFNGLGHSAAIHTADEELTKEFW